MGETSASSLSNSVRVCNCTELGYCYTAPESRGYMGTGPTVGILVGILLFCGKADAVALETVRSGIGRLTGLCPVAGVLFFIVIKRINKGKKEQDATAAEEERKVIL